ncbi:hypothetical protein JCM9140_400 [Halalkalibacter wakoensis JCM 9140]|uniref:Uncharacterized protein n=1 Tax=Halalkalibacter wakoensis JCM 9140 TaxID=1236970 RepID=W4PZE6_9BACI|nr:hypothetical protein [Halalkalibacter wakoensis]GAE24469.1 hypothetical protein JCM9140_400 [Halalkalibacter wakoensis JCM 9140]
MEMHLHTNSEETSCSVTVIPEHEIFTLHTFDHSSREFHSGHEMLAWIKKNWNPHQFENEEQYLDLIHAIADELKERFK